MKTKLELQKSIEEHCKEWDSSWLFIKKLILILIDEYGENWPEEIKKEIPKFIADEFFMSLDALRLFSKTLKDIGITKYENHAVGVSHGDKKILELKLNIE
ncbi:MAG: hypothetical protein NTW62_02105 [Candidatus Nomurabacteria bacterium]|nr:hypothetical protein [Candidatus Nomurabacteria bacterium]